jgi:hypothetical protein
LSLEPVCTCETLNGATNEPSSTRLYPPPPDPDPPYPPLLDPPDPPDPKKLLLWPPPLLFELFEKKLDPPEPLLSELDPPDRKKLEPLFPPLPPPLPPPLLPKKEFEPVPRLSLFCLLKKLSA